MNKRQLHHAWRRFRLIKPWYFLVAAVLFGIIFLFAMRSNSQHMAGLRDQVYAADKNNTDVQGALKDLQAYVTAHMNTSLSTGNTTVYPPIQLQYTYERLVSLQGASAQANNGDLYSQAQAYCQAQNPTGFSGRGRVPCIEQYVQQHGSKTSLGTTISPSLYQFDFVSPRWSPDLAGWSLVLAVGSIILAAATFLADRYLKKLVK